MKIAFLSYSKDINMDEGQWLLGVLAMRSFLFLFFNDIFSFWRNRPYPNITRLHIKWKYWVEPYKTANKPSFLPYKEQITYDAT